MILLFIFICILAFTAVTVRMEKTYCEEGFHIWEYKEFDNGQFYMVCSNCQEPQDIRIIL